MAWWATWYASEILVSLMLVYVAEMVLKLPRYNRPAGYNFLEPHLRAVTRSAARGSSHITVGLPLACWRRGLMVVPVPLPRTGNQVGAGAKRQRATRKEFSPRLWLAAGHIGRDDPVRPVRWNWPGPSKTHAYVPAGYGAAAIIVAGCIAWAWCFIEHHRR